MFVEVVLIALAMNTYIHSVHPSSILEIPVLCTTQSAPMLDSSRCCHLCPGSIILFVKVP